ncbi:hypothetical protein V8B55DRAFT_1600863 [Mucor lusitanicus]|uniref:Uncharacterized protein n=2 Tax=Mucor circinelloides f. lusitanicus TaxID=29924 RepID=A0A168HJR8_MUCCL|nr:hypothetical protein FB192DRAFT_1347588 [Mucor lusitanicus]OAC98868.1 hypothetical protein MUCCIDRAFT_167310 [Mucor lusitanicus CBS 277.49]
MSLHQLQSYFINRLEMIEGEKFRVAVSKYPGKYTLDKYLVGDGGTLFALNRKLFMKPGSSGNQQGPMNHQELNSKEHEQSDKDADGSSVESGKNDVGDCQLEYDSESSVDDDIVDIEDEDEDNEAEFLHDNEALEDFVEQIGNTSTASGSNQLPQGFYSTVNFNIHTAAFVGMFGADGVNASAYYLTGLSCFSLLISVSSSGRRIRAVSLSKRGKRFKAGFHMNVHWGCKNKKLAEERRHFLP